MKRKMHILLLSTLSFSAGANIGGTCCPFSDEALKVNIQLLDISLEKLLSLKGVSYAWTYKGSEDIGLNVQDVGSSIHNW